MFLRQYFYLQSRNIAVIDGHLLQKKIIHQSLGQIQKKYLAFHYLRHALRLYLDY